MAGVWGRRLPGTMQKGASVALVAPLLGWEVDRTQSCTALHIAAGLGERGEPQHPRGRQTTGML